MICRITYTVLCYPNWLTDGLWNDCRVSKHVAVAYIYIPPYCLVLWWKLNISKFLHSFISTFLYRRHRTSWSSGWLVLMLHIRDVSNSSMGPEIVWQIFRRFPQPLEAHFGLVSQIVPFRDYRYMLCKRHNSNFSSAFFVLLLLLLFLFLLMLLFLFFLDGTTVQCDPSPPYWISPSQLCFLTCLSNL